MDEWEPGKFALFLNILDSRFVTSGIEFNKRHLGKKYFLGKLPTKLRITILEAFMCWIREIRKHSLIWSS